MTPVRAAFVLALLGGLYLLVPFQAARTCLGMECLEFLIASIPVRLLSVPWGLAAGLIPVDEAVLNAPIRRGLLVDPAWWPRYTIVSAGYLLNLFLLGFGLSSIWRRFRGRPA